MKLLLCMLFVLGSVAFAASEEGEKKEKLTIKYFEYDDRIYSRSKKSEIGEEIRLRGKLNYQLSENTSLGFGAKIYPEEGSVDDKTSTIELEAKHHWKDFIFGVDFDLKTNDKAASSAGTTFGFDQDSKNTYIGHEGKYGFFARLHPFNFGGEVAKGRPFSSWDVTRIYEITGTPNAVTVNQASGETLAGKTIPGVVFGYKKQDKTVLGKNIAEAEIYLGVGVTTFLFPSDPGFDIDGSLTSTTWKRSEDLGYKGGFSLGLNKLLFGIVDNLSVELEYVGHRKTLETGSLLKEAASFYTYARIFGNLVFDLQVAASHAGNNAYRINASGDWFSVEAADELIYSDNLKRDQDWFGKIDYAASGRIGYQFRTITPYILYRYQGPHYVFRERESAHVLRTADDNRSHGGLHRVGLGSYFQIGQFVINPEFEAMLAKNAVFTNSADIQQSRLNSSYRKNDYLARLKLTYKYDQITDILKLKI